MANRQTLKDGNHRILGFIDTVADGKQTILSPTFRPLGTYDPRMNVTKDKSHHTVGSGNLLTTLLRGRYDKRTYTLGSGQNGA